MKKIVLVLSILFLVPSLFLLLYSAWEHPIDSVSLPALAAETRAVTVVVHGWGDTPSGWSLDLMQRIAARQEQAAQWQGIAPDWNPYAANFFRAAVDGEVIGRSFGAALAQHSALQSVHLIGHSVGAFVIYGACVQLKALRPEVAVHSTYLDPLSLRGSHDWFYGQRHFGECGEVAESYIDSDDTVPGSAGPLRHTELVDVTSAKPAQSSVDPHYWPVIYYRQLVDAGTAPGLPAAVLKSVSE